MGLKQIIANKTKSCAVAPPSTRNAQLLDDLDQNTRNLLRNISATTNLKPLENKDYIRNLPRNHDATVQKTDAQLLPLKTPQKLRDKNTELRGDLPSLSGVVGGDNSVNSANSLSDESANDDYETFVIKPVIQESVRQVDDGNNPKITARLEKEDNGLDLSRYAHLITCQQCEHLSLTGTCTLKGTQMYPDAKRDCTSFNALKTERIQIENTPYSHSQMQGFLAKYEKPLFYHLVDCVDCDFEAARYCHDIFKVGNGYDIMLSYFDDALARREALLAQVVKARISGRKLFVGLDYANIGEPQQMPVKPLVYGIGDSEQLFVNHLMTCEKCKPASRIYCAVGLELKAMAGSNSV